MEKKYLENYIRIKCIKKYYIIETIKLLKQNKNIQLVSCIKWTVPYFEPCDVNVEATKSKVLLRPLILEAYMTTTYDIPGTKPTDLKDGLSGLVKLATMFSSTESYISMWKICFRPLSYPGLQSTATE